MLVSRPLSASGHLHGLLDGQCVGLGDRRLAVELPPDGAVMPDKKTGEPRLPARAALIVERIADGAKFGGGHQSTYWISELMTDGSSPTASKMEPMQPEQAAKPCFVYSSSRRTVAAP